MFYTVLLLSLHLNTINNFPAVQNKAVVEDFSG